MLRESTMVAIGLSVGILAGTAYVYQQHPTRECPLRERVKCAASNAQAQAVGNPSKPTQRDCAAVGAAGEQTASPAEAQRAEAVRPETRDAASAGRGAAESHCALSVKEQSELASLVRHLSTGEALSRAQAALALRRFGANAEPAIPGLVALLSDDTKVDVIVTEFDPFPGPSRPVSSGTIGSVAAGTLASIGKPALPHLIAATGRNDATTVANAAIGLRKMKAPEAVPTLAGRLPTLSADRAWRGARLSVIGALQTIPHPEALPALLAAATAQPADSRGAAIAALSGFKDPRATTLLCRLAEREDADGQSALAALRNLQDPAAAPTLRRVFNSQRSATLRRSALGALTATVGAAALPEQLAALKDPSHLLREEGRQGIRNLNDASAVPQLVRLLSDRDAEARFFAATALERLESPIATAALIRALRDPNARVRQTAAKALGTSNDPGATAALVSVASSREDKRVREKALEALGRSKATAAIEPLCRLARSDSDSWIRYQAVQALHRIDPNDQRVQATFTVAANDPDKTVREAASFYGHK